MTLDAMNKYLEDKGFKVKRERDSAHDCYIFTISKQVYNYPLPYTKISTWKYSSHRDDQLKFLNNLIDTFYEEAIDSGLGEIKMIDTDTANDAYKRMLKLHLNSVYGSAGQYKPDAIYISTNNPYHTPYSKYFENLNDAYGPMANYFLTDIEMTRKVSKMVSFTIKNVIFNDPATIVFWMDGTKTVVKAQEDDIFDPEKGLAMAITKKVYGNQGNYYNKLKKWLPEEEGYKPVTAYEKDDENE